MSQLNHNLVDVIQIATIVEAVEAKKRRLVPVKPSITFFSRYDLWMYHAVFDKRLCNNCLNFAKTPRYFGDHLRAVFPYLEIVGVNKIMANVHPYCRCYFSRVVVWSLDDIKWFLTRR